ncbi:Reverse transcriptase (RNA-dependent DNA polymerase) [Popillia japonica]|uniref:Reverse transcriptase (RNA-dependent DNA polymerase) n=1 Tax=Popillia japonica TaxID=7064 RepID=A0AAW1HT71_POPJA
MGNGDWTDDQRRELLRALQEFPELFEEGGAVATTATVRHTIRLKDETPVRVPQYRYTPEKKRIIAEQVERMLAANVIRPSHSSYSSPVVIVPKKNGEPRFCVDFRRLNDRTHDEASPLPPIHEALRDLGAASVFSTLDLRNGYWQVELDEKSKPLTAFTTPDGAAYEFQVMPFGLKGAPTTFQKLMVHDAGWRRIRIPGHAFWIKRRPDDIPEVDGARSPGWTRQPLRHRLPR